ncbi:MAG TPA: DinB family protein [Terriglobales bacterium]|nr:DinB family protein [Terriglobales bacterium]
MDESIGATYLDEAFRSLRGHKRLAEGAFAQIDDEQFFRVIDPESNSVAIIVKHIAGNIRSRFTDLLTSDGEKPWRDRDQEFILEPGTARVELMRAWEESWKLVLDTVRSLQPEDLLKTVTTRGQPHNVLQAVHRAVAHYAYHVGQIVFLAKHLKSAGWKSLSIPRGQSNAEAVLKAEKQRP